MNERDRIELLMKSYNLSPSQFADKTGIQRASVSHILSGRNKPSLEVMLKIYESFPGLSMEWLMAGKGEAPMVDASMAKKDDLRSSAGLFGEMEDASIADEVPLSVVPAVNEAMEDASLKKKRLQSEKAHRGDALLQSVEKTARRASQARAVSQIPVVQRKVKEVRIYYTDGTYETLLPERL